VSPAQFSAHDIVNLIVRRKKLIKVSFSVVFLLSTLCAFILPRKYESSITILVQRDETLNPLVSYEMAVSMASEDRLRTFNEIIFSRPSIEALIDSIGLRRSIGSTRQQEDLIKELRKNIKTDRKGDSFSITYVDVDPVRAQAAVSAIENFFVKTELQVEHQRDELTVEFFEKKLDDLRQKFEENQKQMVSLLRQRIQEQPTENRGLYTQVENADKQISDIDTRIKTYEHELGVLRSLPQSLESAKGRQALDELQRADLPLSGDLHTVLAKRDELLQRYTPQYPEVQKLGGQVTELLDRMRKALETEISKQQSDLFTLQQKRGQSINDLKQSSVTQRVDQDKEADYGIYQKLYDEMKVKLEQARTARDLGKRAANQFVVIDPAQVPAEATKPNRTLLIAGGFGLGLFMGLLAAVGAELMDTRVRSPLDVEVYGKPIIAFIPETLQ